MSESDSEIKEPFFGFEHHYHLRSRSQQTDQEPVRPRIVRPVPCYPSNDAAKRRPEIDISPSEASIKTEMADNAALIAALQGFTTAVATDAAARQNQMTQLFQVIGGQQQNHAALQAVVAAPPIAHVMRPFTVAVNALPHLSGNVDEDAQGFVDQVNRVAGLEGWTADNCLLDAVTRLRGTASQWHVQTGQNHGTWALWSPGLVTNFSHTLSFLEWSLMMEARGQKPGESGRPHHGIARGLANPIYIAALTAQLPATFTDFLTRLRDLEQLGLSTVQNGPPVTSVTHTAPLVFTTVPAPPVVVPPSPDFVAVFLTLVIVWLTRSPH
ncbi:hypothetical protein OUZ56_018709 [Daphnia magna]|uniref:Uncharacterized protein n=1 Tax=Daphnia magna TaxID=35525 RepID=A0ABQ9Z9K4_9CRUS|nr:hypothetical protein OUZ56_018709 [Daphnia magna]